MSTSRVFTVGQVLTAAQMNDLPQGLLGVARTTANVGPTSGTTEMDVITAPAVTIAGANRRIRIRFHATGISGTVVSDLFQVFIKEGATQLQMYHYDVFESNKLDYGVSFEAIVDSPTAGSHTYKASIVRASGTGTATVGGGVGFPITITVEDIGI